MPSISGDIDSRVAAVRRFTRFYTRQIGVLQEGLLKTPFSLTESRVLYELANREAPTASELTQGPLVQALWMLVADFFSAAIPIVPESLVRRTSR